MAKQEFQAEVRHEGLNKFEMVRGASQYEAQQKAQAKFAQWEQMWQKQLEQEAAKQKREEKKALAAQLTEEARQAIASIENTLNIALKAPKQDYWEILPDGQKLTELMPAKPERLQAPPKPQRTDSKYNPQPTLLDKLFPSRLQVKTGKAALLFKHDRETWQGEMTKLKEEAVSIATTYKKYMDQWQQMQAQQSKMKQEYSDGSPDAIKYCCGIVLSASEYPETFPKQFELDYNPENKILLVDYALPNMEALPTIKEARYVQTQDEISEVKLADSTVQKLYDDLLYQMALRSIYELYQSDEAEALDSVIFNGWVNSVDRSTGHEANACILSLQANREEFLAINLARVKPKECFRKLKGVGSSTLHSLTPVAPLMKMDRSDKRFVASHDVADTLDETSNLAAMDWEEFEHLIRELFEREFAQGGGEVKVTQASRDGGVDAVAFDPDPIRGGKIVIQAKRYTNVVGVSAVRDLYGTVVNEGATKGILVSTASYGPDAYEFAKGKPLTLLDGGNLLHLLEKHGHKAKIDLKEAKRILAEREKESRGKV